MARSEYYAGCQPFFRIDVSQDTEDNRAFVCLFYLGKYGAIIFCHLIFQTTQRRLVCWPSHPSFDDMRSGLDRRQMPWVPFEERRQSSSVFTWPQARPIVGKGGPMFCERQINHGDGGRNMGHNLRYTYRVPSTPGKKHTLHNTCNWFWRRFLPVRAIVFSQVSFGTASMKAAWVWTPPPFGIGYTWNSVHLQSMILQYIACQEAVLLFENRDLALLDFGIPMMSPSMLFQLTGRDGSPAWSANQDVERLIHHTRKCVQLWARHNIMITVRNLDDALILIGNRRLWIVRKRQLVPSQCDIIRNDGTLGGSGDG